MGTDLAVVKKTWWEDLVRRQKSITDLLPRGIDPARFVKSAFFALSLNPRLFECEQKSVFTGILKAAESGLDLSRASGEAYLVPFKNGKTGRLEAQFLIGYRGLLKLAHRSGKLLDVEARVVYEGDEFEIVFGLDRRLFHVPAPDSEEKGKPIGAYCVGRFVGGGVTVEFMTAKEIDRIRERSRAKDDGPWITDWAEMAKKTVARRASKYWPGLDEMNQALATEEEEGAPSRGLALAIPEAVPEVVVEAKAEEPPAPPAANVERRKSPAVPPSEEGFEKMAEKTPSARRAIADENAEPPSEDPGPVDLPPSELGDLFPETAPVAATSRTAEVKDKLRRGRS